jgi:hypothetical protein
MRSARDVDDSGRSAAAELVEQQAGEQKWPTWFVPNASSKPLTVIPG